MPRASTRTATPAGWPRVEWGTALGIVRELHKRGHLVSVTADETRPLLQGSRLTAFELAELGIEHRIVVDGAGPSVIARGLADAVIVGADRIAANGDVANKIGTYPLALAPRGPGSRSSSPRRSRRSIRRRRPAPTSRSRSATEAEVLAFGGARAAPPARAPTTRRST